MKRLILGTILSGALTIGAISPAFAADHSTPGTPGAPNCKGQTIAYLNEFAGQNLDVHGLGNLARFAGLSVQQIHDIVDAYCAGTP